MREAEDQIFERHAVVATLWEGCVTKVLDNYFVAEVIDVANGEVATTEFELKNVLESDLALCKPGALFYWSISYDIEDGQQQNQSSVIRFRRLKKNLRIK